VHVAKKQGCIAIQMEQEEAKDEWSFLYGI
jgi:hypothetical protein